MRLSTIDSLWGKAPPGVPFPPFWVTWGKRRHWKYFSLGAQGEGLQVTLGGCGGLPNGQYPQNRAQTGSHPSPGISTRPQMEGLTLVPEPLSLLLGSLALAP